MAGVLGVLGSGPALLVLDNCEQVVRGAADLVQALVSSSKDLRVLATSRAPLGLTSEAVYALPELGLDTSVELFTQRARAARPGVELPPDAVAELCRHLDGLPLAVELAAARVRVLSVPEIARRLGDRFALLRGGARDAPERHRTLHAVVEWSWNLLTEDARAALRTLSVFPGGFSGEAAEQVLGEDALLLLEQLADQSLLTVADTPAGVRFRMLETVREFSAARRTEAGEDEEAVGRFLAWARDFGVAHHDWLLRLGNRGTVWERIRAEQDNLVLGPAARPGPYGRPHHGRPHRRPRRSVVHRTPTTPASPPSPRTPARRCRTTTPSPSTSKSPAPQRCCARRACSWATARTRYASSSPSGGCPRPRRTRCCAPSRSC